MFFYLHLMQLQTSNFQFLQLVYVSKNEKNRCSRCCRYYSVPPPSIRQISRGHFLKHNLDISLAYPSGMLFLTISGEVPVHQNKVKMCLHFDRNHTAPMFEIRLLRLLHLCEGVNPFTESSLSPSQQTESLVTGFASNSPQSSFVSKMASGVVNGKCDGTDISCIIYVHGT